ncbi:MAG: rRNA (guanosine2251-2-O)-methyltransferase [Bacteroidota bacterium]|nr:rRNA (guanosine2251-2-O)-methyltransferase [Bacteroidota bacterium]
MYIFGRNAIIEALSSGASIEKIFVAFSAQGEAINTIFSKAKKSNVPCVKFDGRKFAQLEKDVCPEGAKSQGVIALIKQIETISLFDLIRNSFKESTKPLLVALDGITDPHNLGAIARSADCAGALGLIMQEKNSAPLTPVAIKASAGALEHIPIAKTGNLGFALEQCKQSGYWIIGSDPANGNDYTEKLYDRPIVLVIGSEGEGICAVTRKQCDVFVKISMAGKINSLNSSVASGVLLFEILRQKRENY